MNDTQWPRWEVFKKDTAKKPYQAVGSIHAVDSEHALLNARNVFVRRPQAVSLWAVRADDILSMTQEELAKNPQWAHGDDEETAVSPPILYEIFRKSSHRRSMTFMDHVGQVSAVTAVSALQQAIAKFTDKEALAWWVVPLHKIAQTEPDVAEAWFDPAETKTYKQQSQYGFISPTRGKNKT